MVKRSAAMSSGATMPGCHAFRVAEAFLSRRYSICSVHPATHLFRTPDATGPPQADPPVPFQRCRVRPATYFLMFLTAGSPDQVDSMYGSLPLDVLENGPVSLSRRYQGQDSFDGTSTQVRVTERGVVSLESSGPLGYDCGLLSDSWGLSAPYKEGRDSHETESRDEGNHRRPSVSGRFATGVCIDLSERGAGNRSAVPRRTILRRQLP